MFNFIEHSPKPSPIKKILKVKNTNKLYKILFLNWHKKKISDIFFFWFNKIHPENVTIVWEKTWFSKKNEYFVRLWSQFADKLTIHSFILFVAYKLVKSYFFRILNKFTFISQYGGYYSWQFILCQVTGFYKLTIPYCPLSYLQDYSICQVRALIYLNGAWKK